MRVLMIGDIIGKPGRRAVCSQVPELRREYAIDLVIANGENTAGGFGITLETAYELLDNGVDLLTSGNHIWDQKEIIPHLDEGLPLIRPSQLPRRAGPGLSAPWRCNGDQHNRQGVHATAGLPLPHGQPSVAGGQGQ